MDEPEREWLGNREWLKNRISLLKARYIQSFWGAAASLFLLQIFGYFLFQSFALYMGSLPVFLDFPGCMGQVSVLLQFLAILLYFITMLLVLGGLIDFQGRAFNNLRDFFSQNSEIPVPANEKEAVKLILSVLFFIAFVYLIVYPPLPGASFWQLALFYAFCWAVSVFAKKRYLQPTNSRTRILAFFFLGIFIALITMPDFGNWGKAAIIQSSSAESSIWYCPPPPAPSNLYVFIWGLAMMTESLVSVLFSE